MEPCVARTLSLNVIGLIMKRTMLILLVFIFVLGLTLLIAGGVALYQWQEGAVRLQVERELDSVAHLKADQIAEWRERRLQEGAEVIERPLLIELLREKLAAPDAADDALLRAEFGRDP